MKTPRKQMTQEQRAKRCVERKRYRAAHPDKIREKNRRYRAAHPEQVRETERKYRAAHPDKVRGKGRRYRAAHPDKVREYMINSIQKKRELRRLKIWYAGVQACAAVAQEAGSHV